MEDRQGKLEVIAEKYAERHGISKDEALTITDSITIAARNLIEAFRPLVKEVIKTWNEVKNLVQSILDKKDRDQYHNQENWIVNWDTRKKSLVISNRPQHTVRKIIR